MLAVDTKVLVRLLARDDTKQALAAYQAVIKGAWISHLVPAEAVWVIDAVYARDPKQLMAAFDLAGPRESGTAGR
jgi:predicted nucleic-acid-binding protein